MSLLLDTHALVWWLLAPDRLSKRAHDAIRNGGTTVYVSTVSIYEIDYRRAKARAAGLRAQDSLLLRMPANMPANLPLLDLTLLDVTAEAAWRAARLPLHHKDPWDRILVAQANLLDVDLVTSDSQIAVYDVNILW